MLLAFFLWFAALQAVVLAVALSAPRHRVGGERLLAALMLVVAIDIAFAGLYLSGLISDWPHLLRLNTPVAFLYAPLTLFVVASLLGKLPPKRHRLWVHGLPALLIAIYFLPLYGASVEQKMIYLDRLSDQPLPLESYLIGGLKRTQLLIYLVVAVLLFRKSEFSSRRKLPALGVLIAFSLVLLGDLYDYGFNFGFATSVDRIQMLTMAVAVLILTAVALFRTSILPKQASYRSTGPSQEDASQLIASLRQHMTEHRPFLDPRLSLAALAGSVGTTTHELSRVLNQHYGENYASYINRHRVDVARRLLQDSRLRITDVMEQAGFNSTSTFNAAFRRVTGLSPREYRQQSLPD